jgi:hypothetical protein
MVSSLPVQPSRSVGVQMVIKSVERVWLMRTEQLAPRRGASAHWPP